MAKVSVFFSGDFCCTPSPAPIKVSEELKDVIASCDFKVSNFEVPLKPDDVPPQSGMLYQHDEVPEFLRSLGFNLFSFANNHAFDYGEDGWRKTMRAFGNEPFGSGTYDDAYQIKVVEKDGVKIGFLALCYAARFGVFDNSTDKSSLACAWVNDLRVNHVILKAKQEVDYLVVLPHDGIEYIDIPMPETIARYRDFVEYGADAVIASHPHCPQGWESYKGKLIFYSLGNFFFNSKSDYDYRADNCPHWYEGLCVKLVIEDGEVSFEVFNTLNDSNVALKLDNTLERVAHNNLLCDYLNNEDKYREVLEKECLRLNNNQELNCAFGNISELSFKIVVKGLIKYFVRVVKRKQHSRGEAFRNLIKNDTRRALFLRGLAAYYK